MPLGEVSVSQANVVPGAGAKFCRAVVRRAEDGMASIGRHRLGVQNVVRSGEKMPPSFRNIYAVRMVNWL